MAEPTRLRSTVWRRLKALGAVYLQNSVAALPDGQRRSGQGAVPPTHTRSSAVALAD